jgi:hypothetical protein
MGVGSSLLHNTGNFADLAEEEHALMSERDLALQARIRLANAAYHSLTLLSKDHLTYRDKANFSD